MHNTQWLWHQRFNPFNTSNFGYAYDPIGNRLSASHNAATNLYAANSLNQYTSITNLCDLCVLCGLNNGAFAYDADGNMTADERGWRYVWNGENRMICASNDEIIVTYAYDHRGRMVRKNISHGDTETRRIEYLWDDWNIIRETLNTNHYSLTTVYVWGLDLDGTLQGAGGVGGLLAVVRHNSSTPNSSTHQLYFPTYDANGNISEYASESGEIVAHYDYSPFGEPLIATGQLAPSFTHQFSAKPYCAVTGFSEYQMRKYNPVIGRWMSRDRCDDLISIEHTDLSASLLYNYVNNSPLYKIDHLGLHTNADCEFEKELCDNGCRRIPPDQKFARKLCWIRCINKFAACIASSDETLITIGCAAGAVTIAIIAPQLGLILIPAL